MCFPLARACRPARLEGRLPPPRWIDRDRSAKDVSNPSLRRHAALQLVEPVEADVDLHGGLHSSRNLSPNIERPPRET